VIDERHASGGSLIRRVVEGGLDVLRRGHTELADPVRRAGQIPQGIELVADSRYVRDEGQPRARRCEVRGTVEITRSRGRDGHDAAALVDGLEVERAEGALSFVEIVTDPQQVDCGQKDAEADRGPEYDENEPDGAARSRRARPAGGQSVRCGLRPG
jgi:hypothetical protein